MSSRVYLPTTLADLAGFVAEGVVPGTLEGFSAPDEDEASEYDALMEAAAASAALLGPGGRRVVLVAEVSETGAPVPLGEVVAVHVDTVEDADPDDDLAWYATQEIDQLLP